MNEEEKKEIEFLKENMLDYEGIDTSILLGINLPHKTLLNLIEKLQKENEELKSNNKKYTIHLTGKQYNAVIENAQNDINQKWIQKVKDKREKLNEKILNAPKYDEKISVYRYQKQILQELIEEREEK